VFSGLLLNPQVQGKTAKGCTGGPFMNRFRGNTCILSQEAGKGLLRHSLSLIPVNDDDI